MAFRKRSGQTEAAAPWLMVILLIAIVIVAIVAYLKATSLIYSDASKTTNYELHTILSSTNCTPQTKIPFRDVLGIGIGEEMYGASDSILINYGGVTDIVTISQCFTLFEDKLNLLGSDEMGSYRFYVEHQKCPKGKCFEIIKLPLTIITGSPTGQERMFDVGTYEYIALPSGDAARVVFKTNDGRFA